MNVEIGTEAAQFPVKEYINGIFLALPTCFSSVSDVAEIDVVHTVYTFLLGKCCGWDGCCGGSLSCGHNTRRRSPHRVAFLSS
jgi:hypothetical protein